MALQKFTEGFTFDDVLIRPGQSSIEPREASLKAVSLGGVSLSAPFLSAAMDRVTGAKMAITLRRLGGLGVLHRNCTIEEQCAMVMEVKKAGVKVAAGCGPFDIERARALQKAGVDIISIDCAHGHNTKVLTSAQRIKRELKIPLIMGNIATKEAAEIACRFADAVKVGIGPGSICTTRVMSGVGVPQFSAILEVAAVAKKHGVPVIADGGMRTSGDIAKALAAGADFIMTGNLFAGTAEAPGKITMRNGVKVKDYRGMGSKAVIETKSAEGRYMTKGRKAVPEGIEAFVPYRGALAEVVAELSSGIQVAMAYVGAKNISEFQKRAKFVRITSASIIENAPHSLIF